jgi:hypothetical protein
MCIDGTRLVALTDTAHRYPAVMLELSSLIARR